MKLWVSNLIPATTQEIYSSWTHKTDHFQRIHMRTGVPFSSMLFFDDEDRNIQAVNFVCSTTNISTLASFPFGYRKFYRLLAFVVKHLRQYDISNLYIQVSKMGVTSILVHRGVNLVALRQGLKEFAQKSSSRRS